jgi:peroxiredoxin
MILNRSILAALVAAGLLVGQGWSDEPPGVGGAPIPNFSLRDSRGKVHALADHANDKLVVVTFLGCECPVAKMFAPRLAVLAKEFGSQGVAFLAIDANSQDSLSDIAEFVRCEAIEFPVLKDVGNVVADQFGALRTPEVFVLDAERVVRYRGRIDDQYLVGQRRPKPTREDLKVALQELLAGQNVSVAQTTAVGCHIGRIPKPQADARVTYTEHISRVLQDRCVSCHRPGEIAPFPLTSYQEAAGWAETICEVVDQSRMPPWLADPAYGHFANNPTLSADEKQLLRDWLDGGAPEGDPKQLPEPRKFTVGWQIAEPDQVLYIAAEPVDVPAEGTVKYRHYLIDPGFTTDRWIQAAECRPGNRGVVHHIVANFIPPGTKPRIGLNGASVGFAPGIPPVRLPEGAAMFVPAGSKVLFQMHYTPNGSAAQDRSALGLVFADPTKVRRRVEGGGAANVLFELAPGVGDVEVQSQHRFSADVQLLSLMPHMHLRGKSFRYEVQYPDGGHEILLSVPHYDFNWQLRYELAEPKLLPAGTLLTCTAHFDNSEKNLANPDPTARVSWGEQTWDEMMIGYYGAVLMAGNTAPVAAQAPAVRDDADAQRTAEQLIRQGVDALGGEKRLAERHVLDFKVRGKVYLTKAPTTYSGSMTADPAGYRTRVAVAGDAFNLTLVLDGDRGWLKLGERVMDLPREAIDEQRERLYCEGVVQLAPILADHACRLALIPDTKLGDQKVDGVRVRSEGHRDVRLYFDAQTHLLLKSETEINEQGKEIAQETLMQDYAEVDGVQRPRKIFIRWDGVERAEREASDFHESDPADSAAFAKP